MPASSKKCDNHNPLAKLELRRHFLRRYHKAGPLCVLDCCQGGGLLWNTLRREFKVKSYWGLDLKPKKGRLKLDSVRVLSLPGWTQNVIDVDTYGAPWKHWEALLLNVRQPTTVFLTIGKVMGGSFVTTDKLTKFYLRLHTLTRIPPTLVNSLHHRALPYALARAGDFGVRLVEAVEAVSSAPHARYIGVRLEPRPRGEERPDEARRPHGP